VATVDRASWDVPAVFRMVRDLGGVPRRDLENTLNLGVGMVAVVGADGAEAALTRLSALGVPAWALGSVETLDASTAQEDLVAGTKGVSGGAVRLVNEYRL
jgi:phosphoribosylformylglycinamidine cyclo-ligase